MIEQTKVETGTVIIDEPTARQVMGYYKINHDEFVKYVKSLGIEHID